MTYFSAKIHNPKCANNISFVSPLDLLLKGRQDHTTRDFPNASFVFSLSLLTHKLQSRKKCICQTAMFSNDLLLNFRIRNWKRTLCIVPLTCGTCTLVSQSYMVLVRKSNDLPLPFVLPIAVVRPVHV